MRWDVALRDRASSWRSRQAANASSATAGAGASAGVAPTTGGPYGSGVGWYQPTATPPAATPAATPASTPELAPFVTGAEGAGTVIGPTSGIVLNRDDEDLPLGSSGAGFAPLAGYDYSTTSTPVISKTFMVIGLGALAVFWFASRGKKRKRHKK